MPQHDVQGVHHTFSYCPRHPDPKQHEANIHPSVSCGDVDRKAWVWEHLWILERALELCDSHSPYLDVNVGIAKITMSFKLEMDVSLLCRLSSSRLRFFRVFCTTASFEVFFLLGRLGAMTDLQTWSNLGFSSSKRKSRKMRDQVTSARSPNHYGRARRR
jgi:hypothetical protein